MSLSLSNAVFWIAAVACVVAQLGILRATRAQPTSGATSRPHRTASRAEEVAWAVIPAVALALVLVLTWRAVHARAATPAATVPASATHGGAA
jgi:heme/copper-type cytochrome/quinol oxidase subunit 2